MQSTNFPFKVRAIADYHPTSGSELTLVTGQIYEVLADDGKGVWYQSTVNGHNGWFPANYTEPFVDVPSPRPQPIPSPRPSTEPESQKTSLTSSGGKTKLKSSKDKTKTGKGKTKKSKSGSTKKSSKPPIPLKTYAEKNKKNLPCTVHLQGMSSDVLLL